MFERAVGIRQRQQIARFGEREIERPPLVSPMYARLAVFRQALPRPRIHVRRQIGIDLRDRLAVERSALLGAVVEADHRDVDVGAVENPVAVGPGHEDVAGFLDAFQDGAVVAAADALGGEETDADRRAA